MSVLKQAQPAENVLPVVVALDLFSRHAAEQHQVQSPGIIEVRRDIQEILADPPQAHRGCKWITILHQKGGQTDGRDEELP